MRFPYSRRPHEDGIFFLLDEMKVKETHHLRLINGFGEGEIEGVNGFDDREVGLSDKVFDPSLLPGGQFLGGEDQKEVRGREVFLFPLL